MDEPEDFDELADGDHDPVQPVTVIECPGCADEDLYGYEGETVECENCGEVVQLPAP